MDGAAGVGGIYFVGRSSCYACSTCAGIGDGSLGGAASGADSVRFLPANCVHW